MKILKTTRDKHVKNRFYVKAEGLESFPMTDEGIAKYGLKPGVDIDEKYLDEILKEDEKKRALDASLNLLSFSQRSRKELAERLKLKKFTKDAAGHAINRLKELGYINDKSLAKNLITLRRAQGKGAELIKFEMKRKGIPSTDITEVFEENRLSPQEEARNILPLARKKLSLMRKIPADTAVQRLMGFLARRGFSVETVQNVLKLLKKDTPEE